MGQQAAERAALGDQLVAQAAQVALVGVSGDHHFDLRVQTPGHIDDIALELAAILLVEAFGGFTALVDHRDHGIHPLFAQFGQLRVDRLGLVNGVQTVHALLAYIGREVAQHRADKGDFGAVGLLDTVSRQQWFAGLRVDQVGRHIGEARAAVVVVKLAGLVRARRHAAAIDLALQLQFAQIQFMVANHTELEPQFAEGFERRLIGPHRRHRRAAADHVARANQQQLRVLFAQFANHAAQGVDTPRLERHFASRCRGIGVGERGGGQIAVKIVDRGNIDSDRLDRLLAGGQHQCCRDDHTGTAQTREKIRHASSLVPVRRYVAGQQWRRQVLTR